MGLLSSDAWKRRILRNHQAAQRYFLSPDPKYARRLTRMDVIVNGDPFSVETAAIVEQIEDQLNQHIAAARFRLAGHESFVDRRDAIDHRFA